MVQCAAFDLDATIKASIRVWKGVVEYSPRPWMPATWFSATVASADADWQWALLLSLVTGAPAAAGASLD